MVRQLVLVKHAQPVLDPAVPPRQWTLGPDGEEGARRLARALAEFMPFALASSPEPKARRTAAIVGAALGVEVRVHEGLEEFDRPALPLMSREEHWRVNAAIFSDPRRPALGAESGEAALERFRRGIGDAIEHAAGVDTLVAIAHGTVITLLAAAHNELDPMDLWSRLECPSFIVLSLPGFRLGRVVPRAG